MAQQLINTCDKCGKEVNAWLELSSDGDSSVTFHDMASLRLPVHEGKQAMFCSAECLIAWARQESGSGS